MAIFAVEDVDGLKEAIEVASPGDVIELAPGTYAQDLELAVAITLRGTSAPDATVITHGGAGLVTVDVLADGVVLEDLTVTGNGVDVRAVDATGDLTLRRVVVADGADNGSAGGLRVRAGAIATIEDSTFRDNVSAGDGAHVHAAPGAILYATRTTFERGVAVNGGAIRLDDALGTFDDCTFTGNTASGRGGAIAADGADATPTGAAGALLVAGGTFEENTAGTGGAVDALHLLGLVVTDVALVGNRALRGGAVHVEACCTLPAILDRLRLCGNLLDDDLDPLAPSAGTAVRFDAARGALRNALVLGSDASRPLGGGGAIDAANGSGVELHGLVVAYSAGEVPALSVGQGSIVLVENSLFVANGAGAPSIGVDASTLVTGWDAFVGDPVPDPLDAGSFGTDDPGLAGAAEDACSFAAWSPVVGSPLVDAGDPAVLDLDGTRSDIGLTSGPTAPVAVPQDTDLPEDTDVVPAGDDDDEPRGERPVRGHVARACSTGAGSALAGLAVVGLVFRRRRR